MGSLGIITATINILVEEGDDPGLVAAEAKSLACQAVDDKIWDLDGEPDVPDDEQVLDAECDNAPPDVGDVGEDDDYDDDYDEPDEDDV